MFKQLKKTFNNPRQIMKVTKVNIDGTLTVSSASGGSINAIGTGTIDTWVYVQEGRILGVAANLPHSSIEV